MNGIVGHKEDLSNEASCSSRMTAYVIAGSEFMEGGPIYMHDRESSVSKRKAVLLSLTMGPGSASAFRMQSKAHCTSQIHYLDKMEKED